MKSSKDHASPLWDRAEECQAIAAAATDAQHKAEYLKLADCYLELATKEKSLAAVSKEQPTMAEVLRPLREQYEREHNDDPPPQPKPLPEEVGRSIKE